MALGRNSGAWGVFFMSKGVLLPRGSLAPQVQGSAMLPGFGGRFPWVTT